MDLALGFLTFGTMGFVMVFGYLQSRAMEERMRVAGRNPACPEMALQNGLRPRAHPRTAVARNTVGRAPPDHRNLPNRVDNLTCQADQDLQCAPERLFNHTFL